MGYSANTLTAIAPVLLREGLLALRENSIMASQCQFDVKDEAAQKNATIDVELPFAVPAQEIDVSTANTATALVPTVVPVTLDQWYESKFSMSDKDIAETKNGLIPMSASEAVKSLANKIDATALALYKDIYGQHGTAGTAPSAVGDITGSRKVLNSQLAPLGDRTLLLDTEAEAKMLELSIFTSFNQVGNTKALTEGSLGAKYGFDIHMDQNMPTHTKGTLDPTAGQTIQMNAEVVAGLSTVVFKSSDATMTGTLTKGDLITFANHDQSYVVTADAAVDTHMITAIISPALVVTVPVDTVVTLTGTHAVNLGFHRQAFCFVSRPLVVVEGLGSIIESLVDPISGCTLRLEISRNAGTKTIDWSYDVLWGVKTIRPELAMRLLG